MKPPAGFRAFQAPREIVYARQLRTCNDVYELNRAIDTISLDLHVRMSTGPNAADVGWVIRGDHGRLDAEYGDYLATDARGDWWPVKQAIFEERFTPEPA
ncbi:MAG: hypothetical protein ACYDCK_01580 [Thermoplasmatota archaeon]